MGRNSRHLITYIVLFIYITTIIWYTVFSRSMTYEIPQTELFWSYRKWFSGDRYYRKEILNNIVMFMPFGFLLNEVFYKNNKKVNSWFIIFILSAFFSFFIETLQIIFVRGLAEMDDILNNSLGSILGMCLHEILRLLISDRRFIFICTAVDISFTIICIFVFIIGKKRVPFNADTSSTAFCFQIEKAVIDKNTLYLNGFAFEYNRAPATPKIMLRTTSSGELTPFSVKYGSTRTDVNDYFLSEYDYTNVGFEASGNIIPDEEYEIMIRWPLSITVSSGVFITGEDVHYVSHVISPSEELSLTEPELSYDFVLNGTLLLYRPDFHLWIYQHKNALYWIADKEFQFEDNNETYIQLMIETTQVDKLPIYRQIYRNDNIGGFFEDYELTGDFGNYRVMKRVLPTEYSITSVMTGYYKNKAWIWKNYFRPIYMF